LIFIIHKKTPPDDWVAFFMWHIFLEDFLKKSDKLSVLKQQI